MNTKRVLLSCTVVSLQDTRFVYPCCKSCLSRLTQESKLRSRCPKCGFTCDTQNVDYRFRLSLKVSRDTSLFGVTVFGGCLNPFFGITASDLQRFVESEKFAGPQSLSQLLIKAVEDCFIGKCLVFGFKLSGRAAESCLLGEHTAESVQFVACQVIPPHGAFLGVTVFAYLQSLMQANARSECSPKAGGQWQQKDTPVSSFDHTLPLCQDSRSENSNDGLTLPHAWHSVSDLVLCFSPEETGGCSLPEVSADDESQEPLVLQWSNGVPSAKLCPVRLSESKHGEHNRLSTSHESSFNASFMSPIKTTPCDHELKSLSFNQWASTDCLSQFNTSFAKKPLFSHTSFALEDAPLSETLGDFVSIEPQIVNQKVLSSTSKRDQATPENSVLPENDTIPRYTSEVRSLHSSLSVLTPLRDVTNDEKSLKRKNRKRKTSSVSKHITKLSHVSKELLSCDIKDVVSKRNGATNVQSHATEEQENQLNGYEDAYNCSADLFHQSSLNILDVAESSVSDTDPKKQDRLADINVSEPNISTFHFAPSLQSTPIVDPSIQCAYGQRRKLSKKWSGLHWSKKRITRTSHIRDLQNHTNNGQEMQVLKSKLNQTWRSDSAFETSECSAGGSELKVDMKHTPRDSALPTATNDCSRDLFDPSF
ncbi:DNA damage-induced apoptosis suppressor protein [Pangasianodon hypophthalmus]|uniref:DNA damage-induced apoptosis suppressor protein n=1 Tax=Pangasianodon hypophthalmus TaxID=310915 RepID=UPI000F00303A|nr:DNA damage-induced apoptosis suppressor protein [Pangasianodon hypophthalmus]